MGRRQNINGNLALDSKKVIVIEATNRPEEQKLRVAAYCRVSSDSSDQMNSFAAQLNYYTALISGKENWTMVDLYADAGISGTSAKKRPDFQRLLSDCRKGRIDKILVKSISRFARNATDCLETIRELKAIGVGVYFEEQNIDTSNMTGELLTAMFSAIAQKESESISGNMRWSYQRRMQRGTYIPPTLPYGYILNDGAIEIDETRADVIRRIFAEYLAGNSTETIADGLTVDEIPCRYGGTHWNSATIRYIISNEKYTGNSVWQKYYTTDTLPYRHPRNRGQKELYYAENTHVPIISQHDFDMAQQLMEQRRKKLAAAHGTPFPLRMKMCCGNCGAVFRRKVIRDIVYWTCIGHDHRGSAHCKTMEIAESEIYAAFLRVYHKLRLHGEPILKQMISNLQSVRERRMLWSLDIIELNKRISDINDQDRMLADMNKCGLVDPDIFIARSNLLAQQLRAAKQEKERILGAEQDDTIPKTRELMEILESMPEFLPEFNGEIFTDLVEKVTADDSDVLRFRLKNGLELSETIDRRTR